MVVVMLILHFVYTLLIFSNVWTGEGIYMFEEILDRRMNGDQQEVLIKWKGYKKTTWEPAENLVKRWKDYS